MKTIIGILLVGLFGFLGCGGSDDGTLAVGEAIPVAPFGIIGTPSPTYEWTPVPRATKYRLVVQDKNQDSTIQDTTETYIIDEWYTAEEAGCASEDGLCSVTPEIEVLEKNTWKVQPAVNSVHGSWSEELSFRFTAVNFIRFTDNGDGTVTDNYTNIIWAQRPQQHGRCDYGYIDPTCYHQKAIAACRDSTLGGRTGWTLPTLAALADVVTDLPTGLCVGILPPFKFTHDTMPNDFWTSHPSWIVTGGPPDCYNTWYAHTYRIDPWPEPDKAPRHCNPSITVTGCDHRDNDCFEEFANAWCVIMPPSE